MYPFVVAGCLSRHFSCAMELRAVAALHLNVAKSSDPPDVARRPYSGVHRWYGGLDGSSVRLTAGAAFRASLFDIGNERRPSKRSAGAVAIRFPLGPRDRRFASSIVVGPIDDGRPFPAQFQKPADARPWFRPQQCIAGRNKCTATARSCRQAQRALPPDPGALERASRSKLGERILGDAN